MKQVVTVTYVKPVTETVTFTYAGLTKEDAENRAWEDFNEDYEGEICYMDVEEIRSF